MPVDPWEVAADDEPDVTGFLDIDALRRAKG